MHKVRIVNNPSRSDEYFRLVFVLRPAQSVECGFYKGFCGDFCDIDKL